MSGYHRHARLARDRRETLKRKGFLRNIYRGWYRRIAEVLPETGGAVLEIGSGPGFAKDVISALIPSDVFWMDDLGVVLDARRLPFGDNTLRAIIMTNVLHHIPDVRAFFRDATRCLHVGGRIVMIEPWVTNWSTFVFRLVNHERLDTETAQWEFESRSPIASANQALPWIVFKRDRKRFENEFPQWDILRIDPCMPLCYILSGGFSRIPLMPGALSNFWERVERRLGVLNSYLAMFAWVVLEKSSP